MSAGFSMKSLAAGSLAFVFFVLAGCADDGAVNKTDELAEQVDGLWRYTGLTTSDGKDLPLTGVFLFKDDMFLQQAVFDAEPFDQAGSMAHAGPVSLHPETGSAHLIAEQTISLDPAQSDALSFQASTEHDVTVARDGEQLTLVFGMGTSTIQEFVKIGSSEGELFKLANGALAFVDGHFILVDGDEGSVTTGYGTYTKAGEELELGVIRWSEAKDGRAKNVRDAVLAAKFDGKTLTLDDGRTFTAI